MIPKGDVYGVIGAFRLTVGFLMVCSRNHQSRPISEINHCLSGLFELLEAPGVLPLRDVERVWLLRKAEMLEEFLL